MARVYHLMSSSSRWPLPNKIVLTLTGVKELHLGKTIVKFDPVWLHGELKVRVQVYKTEVPFLTTLGYGDELLIPDLNARLRVLCVIHQVGIPTGVVVSVNPEDKNMRFEHGC